jgi:uncharacterized protein YjbI with pentapeptide repeats
MEEALLGAVKAAEANFSNANLFAATLADGDFSRASFAEAMMADVRAAAAKLAGASFLKADLSRADLGKADLSDADLRHVTLTGAQVGGARFNGAKVAGMMGTGGAAGDGQAAPAQVPWQASWVDASPAGDGSGRVTGEQIAALLTGVSGAARGAPVVGVPDKAPETPRRYFGRGDVLRDASLEFEPGARVEIDSLFQNCSITLGEGTELVVGDAGVLADCRIAGGGLITINGQFFERESPGIVAPRELTVSRQGAMVASVQQAASLTRFAFQRGSRLRVKILKATSNGASGSERRVDG